ncbi:unnamed protein product [Chrysoparadoxa australica]
MLTPPFSLLLLCMCRVAVASTHGSSSEHNFAGSAGLVLGRLVHNLNVSRQQFRHRLLNAVPSGGIDGKHAFREAGKVVGEGVGLVCRISHEASEGMLHVLSSVTRGGVKDDEGYVKGGTRDRALQFWGRAGRIYVSYKLLELRCAITLNGPSHERKRERLWAELHELNSERMLNLCLDLRGFYLKAGQFLGTRHDFMPSQYTGKLMLLQDQVPSMPAAQAKELIEAGLSSKIEDLFSDLDLEEPIGSASISQVHAGHLWSTGEKVAVKVQFPEAERMMMRDLANLRQLAKFLSKREIKFDLVSPVEEMRAQISEEFNFLLESRNMESIANSLEEAVPAVTVPRPRLASRRILCMTYLEGMPLSSLVSPTGFSRKLFARKGRKILQNLADAWGYMMFEEGFFNADPHPGNILLMPQMRLGLLDWGNTKRVSVEMQQKLATLMLSLRRGQRDEIANAFCDLGIEVEDPDDKESIRELAFSMFETKDVDGVIYSPFMEGNALSKNSVTSFPSELFFVLRSVQLLRGLSHGMGVQFSLAAAWEGRVTEVVDRHHDQAKRDARASLAVAPGVRDSRRWH